MKSNILKLISLALLCVACNISDSENNSYERDIDMSDFFVYTTIDDSQTAKTTNSKIARRSCYTMTNLNRLLDENLGLEQRMYSIEYQTRKFIASKKPNGTPGGGPNTNDPSPDPEPSIPYDGIIEIPVVVNIIEKFNGEVTDAQIASQIAILNEDFNNNNPNTSRVPNEFSGLIADYKISFKVNAIYRKISSKASWGTRDAMKSSKKGGIDATDPGHNLNIWVCEIGGGILGYAQFPGGPASTDGIVIGTNYFGKTTGPYGNGRTATHEVGHWLNLRHIWGDGGCSYDDFVDDTPRSDGPNYYCPTYPMVACNSNDMTMNYMDYVYDDCMYMFTIGQHTRSRALFASDGYRSSFVTSTSN
ncbi:zinc metalloprotease [Aestuariibaculum suncheonense]|uniref:Zinc metalloprotease n=1 Tax=Aestuariibaculum suncheonense TaxID=1028745 RepID=A0A8J6QB82_9FLAO|nr:zinc metalloprotease [Aestuariibaculum suncheonense]MBD0834012.1 zinc metalloprotease [Aestuariibaculum suncheonense]